MHKTILPIVIIFVFLVWAFISVNGNHTTRIEQAEQQDTVTILADSTATTSDTVVADTMTTDSIVIVEPDTNTGP